MKREIKVIQPLPGNVKDWQQTTGCHGRGMEQIVPHSLQKATDSWFQTSSLLNCERINFCHLSHLVCDALLQQPLADEYMPKQTSGDPLHDSPPWQPGFYCFSPSKLWSLLLRSAGLLDISWVPPTCAVVRKLSPGRELVNLLYMFSFPQRLQSCTTCFPMPQKSRGIYFVQFCSCLYWRAIPVIVMAVNELSVLNSLFELIHLILSTTLWDRLLSSWVPDLKIWGKKRKRLNNLFKDCIYKW